MATSESDDFESADEEMKARIETSSRPKRYTSIGSDSDDDIDYIPVQSCNKSKVNNKKEFSACHRKRSTDQAVPKPAKIQMEAKSNYTEDGTICKDSEDLKKEPLKDSEDCTKIKSDFEKDSIKSSFAEAPSNDEKSKNTIVRKERPQRQRKPKEVQSLGAKKLGAIKIDKLMDTETTPDKIRNKVLSEEKSPRLIQECWENIDEINLQQELKNAAQQNQSNNQSSGKNGLEESGDVPEELKSNLKFKDIFKPDGWEGLGEDVELPDDLSDDKYHPVLDKLSLGSSEKNDTSNSWGGWRNWGVSSLINTASVGVSTLTSHVNQGLSLLEETIGVPDPVELVKSENKISSSETKQPIINDNNSEDIKNNHSQYLPSSFGFGNFISSMSSISKLVESTSTKVISGGLDTLETIGKKTMEVLQEGDPGLKKKRAFFLNDADKPILSHILREAKDKADISEKSAEEKQLARRVHFESLFDDYQGLVHLEALEMLSKQCNMKIQQQSVNLDGTELTSMQETLNEIKELCDVGDYDDDEDEEENTKDLSEKLQECCKDLGVSIKYDKLIDIWSNISSELDVSKSNEISYKMIFERGVSVLAQFTAYSVERFHKTAELLLIKERRSTVNEADSLVQLTKTLSYQVGCIANLYCNQLNEIKSETNEAEVKTNISTIFLEATNASTYIQEAFRLFIPILQVGAI